MADNLISLLPTLIAVVAVLIGSVIFAAKRAGSNDTLIDYFVMNKELHAKELGRAFLAADMSVATVVLALGLIGYVYGFWSAVWLTVCWVLGICLFLYWIRKPVLLNHIKSGRTLHELIGKHYDTNRSPSYARISASLVTVVVFFLTIGIEFFAGFVVFTKLPGAPSPLVSTILIALVVIIYTVRGGFRGTTRLNISIRLALIFSSLIILAFVGVRYQLTSLAPGLPGPFTNLTLDPFWAIAVFITLVPAQICAMDMWQRCSAAGGDFPSIRRGLLQSIPFYMVWLVPPYLGALGHSLGMQIDNQNYVVLDVLEHIRPTGPFWTLFLQPIIYSGLVATIGSTTDTLLNATTFTFLYDIYPAFTDIRPEDLSSTRQGQLVFTSKIWASVLGIGSLIIVFIGLWVATVYDLVAALFSIQIILFWPMFYIFINRKRNLASHRWLAIFGLAGGMLTAIGVCATSIITGNRSIMQLAPIAATVVTGLSFLVLYMFSSKVKAPSTSPADAAQ